MTISDKIAARIIELLNESNGSTDIQRNSLAMNLGCVPSQINYVITSRFTPENGYAVVSRRGGGGYISIRRVVCDKHLMLMHVVNSLSDSIDMASVRAILDSLAASRIVGEEEALLIIAACSDNSLKAARPQTRDALRAGIVKQMLILIGNR